MTSHNLVPSNHLLIGIPPANSCRFTIRHLNARALRPPPTPIRTHVLSEPHPPKLARTPGARLSIMASDEKQQDANLLKFFSVMELQGIPVVQQQPKLDLETYISHYRGRTRYDRLITIAKSSVVLCVDALVMALSEAESGNDLSRLQEVLELLGAASPEKIPPTFDEAYMDSRRSAIKAETQRLERELKGYKNNLIKESIRVSPVLLGLAPRTGPR